MNYKQKKRLVWISCTLILLSIASALILFALKQNINLFYTPTQLLTSETQVNQVLRIGGYVKEQSVQFDSSGETVSFIITDKKNEIKVSYHGVLPNLFREGQTVVVTGKLNDKQAIIANQVLAKHDEKYVPKQLENELKRANYAA